MPSAEHPVILFDGVCNLCTWSVRFIIERDHQSLFRFCAQQSPTGEQLLSQHAIRAGLRSIVLIQDGRVLTESDAILQIGQHLPGFQVICSVARWIPRTLRDGMYRIVARYRYKLFGKQESCMIPTPELLSRFL